MAPYNRRMQMQRMPKAEVVHIDPPKPSPPQIPAPKQKKKTENGFLQKIISTGFAAEDWMLIGLILLFLQCDEEEYSMMLPALIYIFLG